jgi:hypothetical protein
MQLDGRGIIYSHQNSVSTAKHIIPYIKVRLKLLMSSTMKFSPTPTRAPVDSRNFTPPLQFSTLETANVYTRENCFSVAHGGECIRQKT